MAENSNRWHVGKEIPLALIATIVAQTLAAIWWASGISRDIDYIKRDIVYLKAQLEVSTGLSGQVQRTMDHNNEQDRRITDMELRIRELERYRK